MKKYIVFVLVAILIVSACALCACNGEELTLYVPDGAPTLAVAKIIGDGKVGNNPVKTVISTGEDVVAKCASGEADMAVLPTNAAVKICSDRDDYQLFTVNVYGVLYVVGTEQIDSIADLQGKTLYSIGLGNTPEYVFKTICDKQGVSYDPTNGGINIVYEAEAQTINGRILSGGADFALIGEPAVTQLINTAKGQNIDVYNLFDLQQLWKDATDSDELGYPQASMIVKKDLLTNSFAKSLYKVLLDNYNFAVNNCDTLKDLLVEAGSSTKVNYTKDIIDRCNLTVIYAKDAKNDIEKYLNTFGMKKYLPIKDGVIYEAND